MRTGFVTQWETKKQNSSPELEQRERARRGTAILAAERGSESEGRKKSKTIREFSKLDYLRQLHVRVIRSHQKE